MMRSFVTAAGILMGVLGQFSGGASVWAQTRAPQDPTPAASAPKGQVPVVDPFARSIKRPSAYGSVAAPVPKEQRKPDRMAPGFVYDDDFARLPDLRQYRVVELTLNTVASKPTVLGPEAVRQAPGRAPQKVYLRLGVFRSPLMARQFVLDFHEEFKSFVDGNYLLRVETSPGRVQYPVDLGPFASERHARLYCQYVLWEIGRIETECQAMRAQQAMGEKNSFSSKAAVGLSSSMIQQILGSRRGHDPAELQGTAIDVEEGDTLGRGDYMIVKITRRGLHMVNDAGQIFLLPADTIPLPLVPADAPASVKN